MSEEQVSQPEQVKEEVKPSAPPYFPEADPNLSHEERVLAYISKRSGQTVKISDFLKSLYPLPVVGAPPLWKDQGNSRRLAALLDKLQSERKLTIIADAHKRLGNAYSADSSDPITKYYDISTISLEAVIF